MVYLLWFNQEPNADETQKALRRSRMRVTKMVLAVTIIMIYVMCWVPTVVVYFLAHLTPSKLAVHSPIHLITIALAALNSAVNPIIYSFQSQRFRQKLLQLLCCGKGGRNQVISVQSQGQQSSTRTKTTTTGC